MKSWSVEAPVKLPGKAPLPRIFDSAQQKVVEVQQEDTASLYVCGITPYDTTHMGHASTYVTFDLLNRAWRDAGINVEYVQNVTDVDDPLLERANATGIDWRELAADQIKLFQSDMVALNILAPDHYIGAVESIPWVVDAVEKLIEKGVAYRVDGYTTEDGENVPSGDVYFDNAAAEQLGIDNPTGWKVGSVCGYSREEMLEIFGERGGDPERPGKKDALDPLLWRVEREGEPGWDGKSLGKGRPGWHIECTCIANQFLPAPFSVQGGGSDLRFPHHDLGSGHAYALNEKPMARNYVHTGMVGLDGEKMSKSLGNLVIVSKLRAEGVEPAVIRLAIMDNHYRNDWFWTDDLLDKAQHRYEVYQKAVKAATGEPDDAAEEVLAQVRDYLAEDLNAPSALVALDQWALSAIEGERGGGELVRDVLSARFGVNL